MPYPYISNIGANPGWRPDPLPGAPLLPDGMGLVMRACCMTFNCDNPMPQAALCLCQD
ncbi:hypothetical protein IGB42_03481 [Andreprevotia sp. IGB-42]|nr:hypothetical protein IGB42_03481 [Andreprevotia sp. IGB-42]